MHLYTQKETAKIHEHTFAFTIIEERANVLYITLNRPEKRNALHPQMVVELAYALNYAHHEKGIWVVLIQANGQAFCAGADLKAMAGLIEEHQSSVPPPAEDVLIGELFNKVHKPTIAVVKGNVYAGGLFFMAGCNIVIAQEDVIFALPEVRRGLFPFQVMAALLTVMPARKVVDWCIRGYSINSEEALQYGLVSKITTAGGIEGDTEEIVNQIKKNSPSAIRLGLKAFDHIRPSEKEHQYLYDMLQKTIATADGQEGLRAFREKREPKWTGE